MSDQVVIPQGEMPAAPVAPTAPALPPEIAYLKEHGLDSEAGSLHAELESLLQSRGDPAPSLPAQAPITQPDLSPTPVAPTAQEKAFDPYAVDGGDDGGAEDGGVVIGDDGRARDAVTGKFVPIKALHKERDLHKQTRSELQQTRELNARVEERLAILNEILTAQDESPAAPPAAEPEAQPVEEFIDPEVDIFKSAKQMQDFIKKQNEYVKKLEEKLSGTETLTRQQIEGMRADQAIRADVTSFYAKQPDFLQAYNHLRTVREKALTTLGFEDKAARDAQIAREEQALAAQSIKNKTSYAERIYKLAQDYGYALKQPEPIPAPPVETPPAAPTKPVVDPAAAAKVEALRAAKDVASPTLNGAGGSAAEGLTVSQLANMSESDFLNLAGKLGKAKLDALLRGT
jgi:hypothetical protein